MKHGLREYSAGFGKTTRLIFGAGFFGKFGLRRRVVLISQVWASSSKTGLSFSVEVVLRLRHAARFPGTWGSAYLALASFGVQTACPGTPLREMVEGDWYFGEGTSSRCRLNSPENKSHRNE